MYNTENGRSFHSLSWSKDASLTSSLKKDHTWGKKNFEVTCFYSETQRKLLISSAASPLGEGSRLA